MDDYTIGVLTNIGLFGFIAISAYLLLVTGEMSFGQQGFFGVGAYAAGIFTAMYGVPLPIAAIAAMACGAGAALLVALPTMRLRGSVLRNGEPGGRRDDANPVRAVSFPAQRQR